MATDERQGSGAFIFGVLLGAIGGALATLFLTPKSGANLRKEIETKVNETTAPVRERAEPLVAQGKERASGFVDKAAERAQEVSGKIAAMDVPSVRSDAHDEPAPTPPAVPLPDEDTRSPETSSQ